MVVGAAEQLTEFFMCSAQKFVKFYCAMHNKPWIRIVPVNAPVTATSYRRTTCCAGNGSF